MLKLKYFTTWYLKVILNFVLGKQVFLIILYYRMSFFKI